MVMMPVVRVAMVGHGAVRVKDATVGEMGVVVAVAVDTERFGRARAEELQIFRARGDRLRRAATAHMPVEADHRIGVGHDDVQIVRDEEDAAAGFVADAPDEVVKRDFAGKIDALHRFVEDQKVRLARDRAGKKHALELAAGQALNAGLGEMRNAGRLQRPPDIHL